MVIGSIWGAGFDEQLTIAAKPCRDALGNYSVIGGPMGRTAAVDHTHFL
jgi:hypothetical protein